MIIRAFLGWVETAKACDRARAANALGRAYLQSAMATEERNAALMAMTYLLDDPSPRVRLALAETLCDTPEAPRALMVSLAEDQPEIAGAVITRSPVLTDADLVDLIGKGNGVTTALIACRFTVSRAVAAAIAEVGGEAEVLTLLENPGACLARLSLKRLAERHGRNCDIRNLLLARTDLPGDARHLLMQYISEALEGFDFVREAIGTRRTERVTREARDVATVTIAGTTDHGDIPALVEHLRLDGRLTPAFLIHTLCCGNVDFVAGSLVNLSGLDDARVRAILSNGRMHAVRALYESAGIRRDVSPVFVEATLMWRKAARSATGTLLQAVCAELLKRFHRTGTASAAICELMDMVEKLHIAEQRQSARSFAAHAALVAA